MSDRDAVRFILGDTDPHRPLLGDREVDFAISKNPNQNLAAAFLADHLFGLFVGKGDISVGPVSKSFSKVAELFRQKALQLREEAAKLAVPSFPATRVSTKDALALDESLTDPSFIIGISDNPFAIQINDDLNRAHFHGFHG